MIRFCLLFIAFYDSCVQANHSRSRNTGYMYRQETDSYYNLHTETRTWFIAREICQSEDAELVVIKDAKEAVVVAKLIKDAGFHGAHIGIQALLAKRDFRTVEGVPMYAAYDNWAVGEPNNLQGDEDCVEIYASNGRLNDFTCGLLRPFVCRKIKENHELLCNKPYKNYFFNYKAGRCYKLHLKELDWERAYKVCKSEESHLAIIYTKGIADALVEMVRPHRDSKNRNNNILLGFHNSFDSGYETVMREPVDSLDYHTWSIRNPKDKCGAMTHNGKLADIRCDSKAIFICEHESRFRRDPPAPPTLHHKFMRRRLFD